MDLHTLIDNTGTRNRGVVRDIVRSLEEYVKSLERALFANMCTWIYGVTVGPSEA